jgi:hypothetical protein
MNIIRSVFDNRERLSFRAAAAFLDNPRQTERATLKIAWMTEDNSDYDDDDQELRDRGVNPNSIAYEEDFGSAAFTRFVTALEGHQNRALRGLDLTGILWEGTPKGAYQRNDLERLFRDVLPVHPTLEGVRLPTHPTEFLRLFTSAIPVNHPSLREIDIVSYGDATNETAEVLASWIRRNTPITILNLDGRLFGHDSVLVCQAVAVNTNLQVLRLYVAIDAGPDTLRGLAVSSSLTHLVLHPRSILLDWPHDVWATFARELRTNTSLTRIWFVGCLTMSAEERQPIVETLKSFNYTLETIGYYRHPDFESLLQRNRLIRHQMNELQARNYDVAPADLPTILEGVNPILSAVYHILRQGNLARVLEGNLARVLEIRETVQESLISVDVTQNAETEEGDSSVSNEVAQNDETEVSDSSDNDHGGRNDHDNNQNPSLRETVISNEAAQNGETAESGSSDNDRNGSIDNDNNPTLKKRAKATTAILNWSYIS